jgi:RNA polymerase sigma-70 factor, ECF subfamily
MTLETWITAPRSGGLAWSHAGPRGPRRGVSEPEPASDVELVLRIAQGDSAALGQLYDLHSGVLFGFAFRILKDHREAEDALQEVFLQVWHKAPTFDAAQGRPLGWMLTLTRNKAIDRLRSAQRRARLVEEAGAELVPPGESPSPNASELAGAGEQAGLVRAALERLQPDQRRAIEMAFFGGLSQTEVAATLNEPLGTIKARIRRGMLRLREELEQSLFPEVVSEPADPAQSRP